MDSWIMLAPNESQAYLEPIEIFSAGQNRPVDISDRTGKNRPVQLQNSTSEKPVYIIY